MDPAHITMAVGFLIGLFLGWQFRDHAQLEREWRERDAKHKQDEN